MRAAFLLVLAVIFSGCIGGATTTTQVKPDDTKMDALFSDALSHATPMPLENESQTPAYVTQTTETTVSTATSSSSTSTTHASTTTVAKTMACSDIQYPMGQRDCDKGFCTTSGYICRYYPGSFVSGAAKCVCTRPKTT
jgi:hypothetical protein